MAYEGAVSAAANVFSTLYNNYAAGVRASADRKENYLYGEMAAENADARTRALYRDFYSPQALLKQYNKAGLSPSMMFGGTPGQGGTTGAQGTGAMGPQTPYMPISLVEAAQAAQLFAQAENTKADTKLKEAETAGQITANEIAEIKKEYERIFTDKYTAETNILGIWIDDEGQKTSLYNAALNCKTYQEFTNLVYKHSEDDNYMDDLVHSEIGQKTLRDIWKISKTMDEEINTVSANRKNIQASTANTEEDTKLLKWDVKLANEMDKAGFASMNAEAMIAFLRAQVQQSELSEMQKGAWNRLINNMKDGTTKDIVIVLGMILGQAMSNISASVGLSKKL